MWIPLGKYSIIEITVLKEQLGKLQLIFHFFPNKQPDKLHNFYRLWKRHNLSSDHSAVNLSGKTSVYGRQICKIFICFHQLDYLCG